MEKKNDEVFAIRDAWYAKSKDQNLETLPAFLAELAEHQHDYSTICYAVAAAALGAARAIDHSPNGGITGFQAGAIMWEFVQQWMHFDGPMRLVQYSDMLYPQYKAKFTSITQETFDAIKSMAAKNLEEKDHATPNVTAHWQSIVDGKVPFGLRIVD